MGLAASTFFKQGATSLSTKDVARLLKHYYSNKNKVENLFQSEAEVEDLVRKKCLSYTSVDILMNEWLPTFLSGDKNTVPVRIYLSAPLSDDKISKWIQFLLSGTKSYGFVHASIQIGVIRFDWFSTNFVKMRDMTKKADAQKKMGKNVENPLIVFDPLEGKELSKTEAVFRKILTTVVEWNREKMYQNNLANCQDFVNQLLQALRINWNVYTNQNALTSYLQHLRDHPEQGTKWFKDNKGEEHIFDTHEDLDSFHLKHFNELAPDEKALLKSFHRAFQIEEANKGNIAVDQLENNCPAGPVTLYAKTPKEKAK